MNYSRSDNNFNNEWKLPLLPDYLKRWAGLTPENDAVVFVDTGEIISYAEFDRRTDLYAMALKKLGINKGDIVVTQYLAVPEFYQIVYGCLKIGAIISPLDAKLQDHEIVRDLNKIENKAFFSLGKTPIRDFPVVAKTVLEQCPYVDHVVQWNPGDDKADIVDGAINFYDYFGKEVLDKLENDETANKELLEGYERLSTDDPGLITVSYTHLRAHET